MGDGSKIRNAEPTSDVPLSTYCHLPGVTSVPRKRSVDLPGSRVLHLTSSKFPSSAGPPIPARKPGVGAVPAHGFLWG